MKKILFVLLLFCAPFLTASDCAQNSCKDGAKSPAFNPAAFGRSNKEKETVTKKLENLSKAHKQASDKEKPKLEKEVKETVTKRFTDRVASEREEISRQKEKLAVWETRLIEQEKNKAKLIEQETQEVLEGKVKTDPWEKLKEKKTKESEDLKKKAAEAASSSADAVK